jgi:hypothetical protein
LLTLLAGLGLLALLAGTRHSSKPWRLTLQYAALFAVLSGVVLVALIGPDSGTTGVVCPPDEACDMEQGMGMVTGPLILGVPILALMVLARVLVSLGVSLARRRAPAERSGFSCR